MCFPASCYFRSALSEIWQKMFPQLALWKCLPHGIIIASLLAVSWGQYDDGESAFYSDLDT